MKTKYIFSGIILLIFSLGFYEPLFTNQLGAPVGVTNAPNESTCVQSNCHITNSLNAGPGELQVDLMKGGDVVTEYQPGNQYTVRLRLTDENMGAAGFELTTLTDSDNSKAGSLESGDNSKVKMGGNREYLTHNAPVSSFEGNTQTWELTWNAPSEGAGNVSFYACANAANGQGDRFDDFIYDGKVSVAEGNSTSVSHSSSKEQFKVYPNPVGETIKFDLPSVIGENGEIFLSNFTGKTVANFGTVKMHQSNDEIRLDLPGNLKSGVYLLQVKGDQNSLARKIIIE